MITDQKRIARWMGWTQDTDRPEYWYTADDSEHEGEPCRLPDLTTPLGRAEWCAVIELELQWRYCYDLEIQWSCTQHQWTVSIYEPDETIAVTCCHADTKPAALTAAVVALMESEK